MVTVFADFLRYLFGCAKSFIIETHANGEDLWKSLQGRMYFVLTHPNGWEDQQRSAMREAAVLAGLASKDEVTSGVQFVTEGEASLHFCIQNGLGADLMSVSITFVEQYLDSTWYRAGLAQ